MEARPSRLRPLNPLLRGSTESRESFLRPPRYLVVTPLLLDRDQEGLTGSSDFLPPLEPHMDELVHLHSMWAKLTRSSFFATGVSQAGAENRRTNLLQGTINVWVKIERAGSILMENHLVRST